MDATRTRRTRDQARQRWYAQERQRRFARFLGFGSVDADSSSNEGNAVRVSLYHAAVCDARLTRDWVRSLAANACREMAVA